MLADGGTIYFERVEALPLKLQATLADEISELPDGESAFAKEISLLTVVKGVMDEAATILEQPHTGPRAIAAESEAIELLLQAKRENPNGGGGGGGTSPGGGGSGTTTESAIAQIGRGDDRDATIEERDVEQSTGLSGRQIPEEFRTGLDEYFNTLEAAAGAGD